MRRHALLSVLLQAAPIASSQSHQQAQASSGGVAVNAGRDAEVTINDVVAIRTALKPELLATLESMVPDAKAQRRLLQQILKRMKMLPKTDSGLSVVEQLVSSDVDDLQMIRDALERIQKLDPKRAVQGFREVKAGNIDAARQTLVGILVQPVEQAYRQRDYVRALHEVHKGMKWFRASSRSRDAPAVLWYWNAKTSEALGNLLEAVAAYRIALFDYEERRVRLFALPQELSDEVVSALHALVPRLTALNTGGLPEWLEVSLTGREHWTEVYVDGPLHGRITGEVLLNPGEYLVDVRDARYVDRHHTRIIRLREGEQTQIDAGPLLHHGGYYVRAGYGICVGTLVGRSSSWGGLSANLRGGYFVAPDVAVTLDLLVAGRFYSRDPYVFTAGPGLGVAYHWQRWDVGLRVGGGWFGTKSGQEGVSTLDVRSLLHAGVDLGSGNWGVESYVSYGYVPAEQMHDFAAWLGFRFFGERWSD